MLWLSLCKDTLRLRRLLLYHDGERVWSSLVKRMFPRVTDFGDQGLKLSTCFKVCLKVLLLFRRAGNAGGGGYTNLLYKGTVEMTCDDTLWQTLGFDDSQMDNLSQTEFRLKTPDNFQSSLTWECYRAAKLSCTNLLSARR